MADSADKHGLRRLRLRYTAVCATCGTALSKGSEALWDRATKQATCLGCAPDGQQPTAGAAGASAAAEGERRKEKRLEDVRRRYGDHAAAVAEEMAGRDAAATWGKGSEGESRIAAFVAREVGDAGGRGMTINQRRDDYPNPWRIRVRGHPARVKSISWRKAIRDAVTDAYPHAPFASPPLGTRFTVEVIFRMTPADLARPACDLDNFAKPVIDTLFTSQNVSRLTGVLLPGVNDTCVFRLLLEKVEVKTPQEQGADLTVSWHPSVTPDLSTS